MNRENFEVGGSSHRAKEATVCSRSPDEGEHVLIPIDVEDVPAPL